MKHILSEDDLIQDGPARPYCEKCGQVTSGEPLCTDCKPAITAKDVGDEIYRLQGKLNRLKWSFAPYEEQEKVAKAIVEAFKLYSKLKGRKVHISVARLLGHG